ncbi:DUF3231 family protein [Candidatus Formimonas warabiya]|uniref:DUF3231 family protein n=1 Tax=Formimonas warabiya TaxID=1761012 RepID=A0A3G1KTI7_FORW1|nr:DUF3231 family protein [Candidatus Formimonas warabiya]ATW25782.1 hypothetical protein DCMF_14320 [Candidatus Formimonas warabiya]
MNFSLFKNASGDKESVDIEEVFNIWSLLRSRHEQVETIQLFRNFVHDRELSVAINDNLGRLEDQINILTKEATKLNIKQTRRPPQDVKTSVQVEEFTDQYIYRSIFGATTEDLFRISRAVRTSTTNDQLRSIFRLFLKKQLDNFNDFLEYGKMKGWHEPDPTFKSAKPVKEEPLNVTEAYHLWDHINLRYDQLELTKLFYNFAHDKDLRMLMDAGLLVLDNEASKLEKELTTYEIPLPQRPPEAFKSPIDPETIEDEFIYRTIFRGIQEAMDLHLRAAVESTRNDSLRRFFHGFLETEMDLFDKYLKYGKMKGWIHTAPFYNEPT